MLDSPEAISSYSVGEASCQGLSRWIPGLWIGPRKTTHGGGGGGSEIKYTCPGIFSGNNRWDHSSQVQVLISTATLASRLRPIHKPRPSLVSLPSRSPVALETGILSHIPFCFSLLSPETALGVEQTFAFPPTERLSGFFAVPISFRDGGRK